MNQEQRDGWLSAAAAAVAAMSCALIFARKQPYVWLCLAVLAAAWALVGRRGRPAATPVLAVVLVAIAVQIEDVGASVAALFQAHPRAAWPFVVAGGFAALAALALAPLGGRARRLPAAAFAIVLAGFFALAAAGIARRAPDIDVYQMHVEAFDRFHGGDSPYAGSFRNIYPHEKYYGPRLVADGRVLVGYAYPPLPFFIALAGDLAGDFRYAFAACAVAAAALLAACRGGPVGRAGALLFLCGARQLHVLEQSWTEPVVALALAGVLFAACRRPRWLPLALAALWLSKQYAVALAPLLFLLLPDLSWRRILRLIAISAALAGAVVLPFLLWDPEGFLRSVVFYQLWQPFRADSTSFLVWWANRTSVRLPNGVTFGALAAGLAAGVLWGRRTPAGFAVASGLALLAFFAFAKQAFANYYYVTMVAFAAAVACASLETDFPAPGESGTLPRFS